MNVTQELIDAFLMNDDKFLYVLNRVTGEILLDASEFMTGEPEIDWDDEEMDENLIVIPQISSPEAFEIMVSFTTKQEPVVSDKLRQILNGRKPFRNFKDTVQIMGLAESWYSFQNDCAKNKLIEWLEEHGINSNTY
jgi:CBS domain-containing protein